MSAEISRDRYDVIVAGARCAGASTAMLLARGGLRVLCVDPTRPGSDTLSTHALMRGGVLQLHRWGLLDAVRDSGAPAIRTTTFHYGGESVEIPIKERDGVGALRAPRRTVLDAILVDAARASGAEVVHGLAVVELERDADGRVRGAGIAGTDQEVRVVESDLVVGADGIRSRVARILDLAPRRTTDHASAAIYGYCSRLGLEGYHWYYGPGASVGSIPTNDGETCVFASVPRDRFASRLPEGLDALYREALHAVSPDLAARVERGGGPEKLRAFAGEPGFLRPGVGPGWALVGDAGYFRDPITAHGITDALRESEFLARAVLAGRDEALREWESDRDRRAMELMKLTDAIASFEWDFETVKVQHLRLARAMNSLVDETRGLDGTDPQSHVPVAATAN